MISILQLVFSLIWVSVVLGGENEVGKEQEGGTGVVVVNGKGNITSRKDQILFLFAVHKTGSTVIQNGVLASMYSKSCYASIVCVSVEKCKGSSYLHSNKMFGGYAGSEAGELMSRSSSCNEEFALMFRMPVPNFPNDEITQSIISKRKDCAIVLHTRNPLDMLVSAYTSFTKNHKLPPNLSPTEKQEHREDKAKQHAMGMDEWVLDKFHGVVRPLDVLLGQYYQYEHNSTCRVLLSRYEDMTLDAVAWANQLFELSHVTEANRAKLLQWAHLENALVVGKEEEIEANKTTDKGHKPYLVPNASERLLKPETIEKICLKIKELYPFVTQIYFT